MALIILRCVFLMVAVGWGAALVQGHDRPDSPLPDSPAAPWAAFVGMVVVSAGAIGVDIFARRKRLDVISSIYFGLIIGLFLTYIIVLVLTPLRIPDNVRPTVILTFGMVLCYTCISVLMQTRDDFRFIIPYVEFAKDVKGIKPYVLDTSVVIDGRIADVVETKVFDSPLIMPRFVLAELQAIADSSDKLRRTRGRRGLDILNRLRNNTEIDLQVHDRELPEFAGQPVDLKLVMLAKHLQGKVMTNDYNLNKVAKLHGVEVVNLNDLATALKPQFLPGENLEVFIVKPGEEFGQGVGYLDDGTMVVVEGGRDHVSHNVKVTVTSVLQTSAGRMIFGKTEGAPGRGAQAPAASR